MVNSYLYFCMVLFFRLINETIYFSRGVVQPTVTYIHSWMVGCARWVLMSSLTGWCMGSSLQSLRSRSYSSPNNTTVCVRCLIVGLWCGGFWVLFGFVCVGFVICFVFLLLDARICSCMFACWFLCVLLAPEN